jgi:broad specificity phosphatase PhoE
MLQTAFLMRHATPDWTRTDIRYDIPPGPPLTAAGEAEARAAAEFLRAHSITKIIASPLERAHRTASIIAELLSLPITVEPQLAEWREDENEEDVTMRSRSYWDMLWMPALQPEKPVDLEQNHRCPLLVTHGGPSRLLLNSLGVTSVHMEHYRTQFDHNNPMPPAGIWRLTRPVPDLPWQMDLVFTPVDHTPFSTG